MHTPMSLAPCGPLCFPSARRTRPIAGKEWSLLIAGLACLALTMPVAERAINKSRAKQQPHTPVEPLLRPEDHRSGLGPCGGSFAYIFVSAMSRTMNRAEWSAVCRWSRLPIFWWAETFLLAAAFDWCVRFTMMITLARGGQSRLSPGARVKGLEYKMSVGVKVEPHSNSIPNSTSWARKRRDPRHAQVGRFCYSVASWYTTRSFQARS